MSVMRLVSIVEFEPKYKNQVISLITTVLEEYGFPFNPALPIDKDLTKIEKIYKARSRFFVAINKDGQVIGTSAIKEVDKTTAKLKRMFLDRLYRGKGIGLSLLRHAINFSKRHGYKKVQLDTSRNMTRAHRLYERYGFKKTSEEEKKFYYELILS